MGDELKNEQKLDTPVRNTKNRRRKQTESGKAAKREAGNITSRNSC